KPPRKESKQALFIEAMRTAKGISITEAAERFGWQAHTVRGAGAGGLKGKLGLKVEAERDEERGTVYRIREPPPFGESGGGCHGFLVYSFQVRLAGPLPGAIWTRHADAASYRF